MRQKLKTMGLLWVALGLAVAGPLAAEEAEPPSPQSFLLRHYYRFDHAHGFDEQEVFVFRDGLAIETIRDSLNGVGGMLFLRSQSLPESFDRLTEALAEHKVGQQVGNCRSNWIPRPEESFTWFGRGKRQNTIVAGTRFAVPCSREVDDLIYEMAIFIFNVDIGDSQVVVLRP
ncbi:MAG TPA: hypothetical protein DD490_03700 [Acidobacteria bacterium]|nr:hypothetical protein [Acidobacteriota bacterium]